MFIVLAAAASAVAATRHSAVSEEASENYWKGAVWQDLQLLFSFVLGVFFVRSAETIFDPEAGGSNQRRNKLELYPLLA